jgi:hypothetical protein
MWSEPPDHQVVWPFATSQGPNYLYCLVHSLVALVSDHNWGPESRIAYVSGSYVLVSIEVSQGALGAEVLPAIGTSVPLIIHISLVLTVG